MYVLGCLLKQPQLLSEVDKVKLELSDFDDKFTAIIFSAIKSLYLHGATTISLIEIESYMQQNEGYYRLFKERGGIEYIANAEELVNTDNFYYYYNRVKKFSAIRKLKNAGYSIKKVYDEDALLPKDQDKMLQNFDNMSIKDIFDIVIKDYAKLEEEFIGNICGARGCISDGMEELQITLEKKPEIGFPIQGAILNTAVRGARRTKFYIRSGATGSGKSRLSLGDACGLAFPLRYDRLKKKWIRTGFTETVLYITTEISVDELQTMVWSYLTDINEEKILFNQCDTEEKERIAEAIRIVKKYKDNFRWEHLPDPTVESVTAVIRNQVRNNNVTHVFYDYIFSSPSLLREFEGQKIREDVVLGLLSTKLKDLANELNIFLMTGTQLNRSWEDAAKTGIRNQNMIRGSTAIIDKCDVGLITLPVMENELSALTGLIQNRGYEKPTHVTDIYKLRRGRYKNIRIWSIVDLGTCRTRDLFATDEMFNEQEIPILEYDFKDWDEF